MTGLGTDGSSKMVPHGVSGPSWDHDEKSIEQYVFLLRLTLTFWDHNASMVESRSGSQAGPRNFLPWSQLHPNPNYIVPIKHFFDWRETWDHLGTIHISLNRNFLNYPQPDHSQTILRGFAGAL